MPGSRCIGDRGRHSIVPSVTAPVSVLNARHHHQHRCCGCGGFSTKLAGRLGGPPTAAVAAAAAGEILCRGFQQLPALRSEECGSIWGAGGMEPAPADGFSAPVGDRAPPEQDQGHGDLSGSLPHETQKLP